MTDTPRLRLLDALFAERVLGVTSYINSDGEIKVPFKHDMSPSWTEMIRLPSFTRSLDAAWEGAVASGLFATFHCVYYHKCDGPSAQAMSASARQRGEGHWPARGDHPAEALVLACLRAVGCTEEELNA